MTSPLKLYLTSIVAIAFFMVSCTEVSEKTCFSTKEDSIKFAKAVMAKYPDEASSPIIKAKFARRPSKQITADQARSLQKNYIETCRQNGEVDSVILRYLILDRTSVESVLRNTRAHRVMVCLGKETMGYKLVGDYTTWLVGNDTTAGTPGIALMNNIWDNASPCPSDCPTVQF